jgi:acetate kinase
LRSIAPEHYFVLKNGELIKSLEEFIIILKKIDRESFDFHVTDQKNDFYNWIRFVFKSKKLAETIADYRYIDKQSIIKAVTNFINERKILIINAGSSSLKFQLIELTSKDLLAKGMVDAINLSNSCMSVEYRGETITKNSEVENHEEALKLIIGSLIEIEIIGNISEIYAIGHRVVHGGEKYKKPTIIDEQVINDLTAISDLAPLHNPPNIACIKACKNIFDLPQVAVFDTAFHSTIPEEKYLYGLPYQYYEKYNIRKYGFHGTNHKYISEIMHGYYSLKKKKNPKLIICHLGNGCSITAVKDRKSFNTTMGFTPTDGLIMGTRSGHLDPLAATHIGEILKQSYPELERLLNKESGLKGICGYSDMRTIWKNKNDKKCRLAMKMFSDRIIHYIGAYIAEMNGLDGIVFTAGIGENAHYIRKAVLENLSHLGVKIDEKKNLKNEFIITGKDSKIEAFIIKADEELQIALETKKLLRL